MMNSGGGAANDEPVFGDFEDLETGESYSGTAAAAQSGSDSDSDSDSGSSDGEGSSSSGSSSDDDSDGEDTIEAMRERARKSKAAVKARFDSEYDSRGGKGGGDGSDGSDDDEDDTAGAAKAAALGVVDEEAALSDDERERRARVEAQGELNQTEFDDVGGETAISMLGYPVGAYVRIVFDGVPAELVDNFKVSGGCLVVWFPSAPTACSITAQLTQCRAHHHQPTSPLLLGGILPHEEGLSLLRMRIKKHRWFPRLLKCNDPLVFSVGWRRFQSLPLLHIQDRNERHRYLKYAHAACFCGGSGGLPGCSCSQTSVLASADTRQSTCTAKQPPTPPWCLPTRRFWLVGPRRAPPRPSVLPQRAQCWK